MSNIFTANSNIKLVATKSIKIYKKDKILSNISLYNIKTTIKYNNGQLDRFTI